MEKIPDEILLKIFDFLNQQELINASRVSERWHSTISSSTIHLNKILFNVNSSNIHSICDKNSNFPIHNIEVNGSTQHDYQSNVKNLFNFHKNSIERLKFSSTSSGFVSNTIEDLNHLTHLTILGIKGQSSEEFSVSLPNLKSLNVVEPSNYLKLIKNHQIEKLSVTDTELELSRVSRALNNFLKKCKNLKDFSYFGILPSLEVEKFPFKLENFSIFLSAQLSGGNFENSSLLNLIKNQEKITKLKLGGFIPREVIQFAVSELKLVKLTMDMEKILADFKNLKINNSLKFLEISKLPNDIEFIEKIIAHCPKIETLKIQPQIREKFSKFFDKVSTSLENLKNLTLHSIQDSPTDEMNFDKIESLTINEIKSDDEFVNFVNFSFGCPKVKKIEIKNFENLNFETEDFESFLIDLEELEILKICGNFKPKKDFFDTIYEVESNLKHLFIEIAINDDNFEEINESVKRFEKINIKITIPELVGYKRELWESERCENEDFESDCCYEELSCDELDENDSSCDELDEEEFDYDEHNCTKLDFDSEDDLSESEEELNESERDLSESEEELNDYEMEPFNKKRKIG